MFQGLFEPQTTFMTLKFSQVVYTGAKDIVRESLQCYHRWFKDSPLKWRVKSAPHS